MSFLDNILQLYFLFLLFLYVGIYYNSGLFQISKSTLSIMDCLMMRGRNDTKIPIRNRLLSELACRRLRRRYYAKYYLSNLIYFQQKCLKIISFFVIRVRTATFILSVVQITSCISYSYRSYYQCL